MPSKNNKAKVKGANSRGKSSQQVAPQLVQQASAAFHAKDYASADQLLRQILALDPYHSEANDLHGLIAHLCGQHQAAKELIRRAIKGHPNVSNYHNHLGVVLKSLGELKQADICFRNALALDPRNGQAHNNLASVFQDLGQFDEALKSYRLACKFGYPEAFSNYLLLLNYLPDQTAESVYQEHLQWPRSLPENLASAMTVNEQGAKEDEPTLEKQSASAKKLRIGYVSPDFREHSVAHFVEPLLREHDRERVTVYCYYNHLRIDNTTQRLQAHADVWRTIVALDDQAVANLIRQDEIDILIDLSGHTDGNRLGVFALKPAPVQVSWLGYPNTTGLTAIHYRLTDQFADPVGEADQFYCEKLYRLPDGFLCYQGDASIAVAGRVPAQNNGYITFASFNNLAKVNQAVVKVWAEILHQVPESRLLLKSPQLAFPEIKALLLAQFKQQGIAPQRLDLRAHVPSKAAHLALYDQVDIALDTFPYNGTTTTCEALWMGVPTLTLMGDRHAARVGASILTHTGLPQLIAQDRSQYLAKAVALAADMQELQRLRLSLREQLKNSNLGDGKLFARNIEQAYGELWNLF